MKKRLRLFLLLTAAVLCLSVPALADSGPKPQITVRVTHAPAEPYYLDLAGQGAWTYTYGDHTSPYSGLDWSYPAEKQAKLDQSLLAALRDAVPEGWHACTAEGTGGAPMWGQLYAEHTDSRGNPFHVFGYVGVPETYRIVIADKSGEAWVSEPITRRVLQSSVTVDWAAKTVSSPPLWVSCVLELISTLIPTLLLEGLVLVLFGYHLKKSWRPFLEVNLLTQGCFSAFVTCEVLAHGTGGWSLILFIPAELAVLAAEILLYRRFLTEHTRARAEAYAAAANVSSAVLGLFLAEPVWRLVVSIS